MVVWLLIDGDFPAAATSSRRIIVVRLPINGGGDRPVETSSRRIIVVRWPINGGGDRPVETSS